MAIHPLELAASIDKEERNIIEEHTNVSRTQNLKEIQPTVYIKYKNNFLLARLERVITGSLMISLCIELSITS